MFLIKRTDGHVLQNTTTVEKAEEVAAQESLNGTHVSVWESWVEQDEDTFISQFYNGKRDL